MKQIEEHLSKALQVQEQVLTALTPSDDGKQLQVAITDTRICQLTELEPLKQALRYVMLLVGIRAKNLPGEAEKQILLTHIAKNYGGHTAAEIRLAFEMAIAGKLEVEDVSCYENFSPLYFSTIMNAYREWAKQEKYYADRVNDKPQLAAPKPTQAQLEDMYRTDVENLYQKFLNGVTPLKELPAYFINILVKDGYIAEGSDDLHAFFSYWMSKGYKHIYIKQ